MKVFHKVYPHENLKTSNRQLFLARPEEIKIALGKQMDYKKITIRRGGEEILSRAHILTFNKSILPKEIKIGYLSKKQSNTSLHSYGDLNVKNKDITNRTVEEIRQVKGLAKKTQTTWNKIFLTKPNVQTAKRIILLFRKFAIYAKKKKREIMEMKCTRNITFLEVKKKISGILYRQ